MVPLLREGQSRKRDPSFYDRLAREQPKPLSTPLERLELAAAVEPSMWAGCLEAIRTLRAMGQARERRNKPRVLMWGEHDLEVPSGCEYVLQPLGFDGLGFDGLVFDGFPDPRG
jgi:hypothetical protein